MTTISGFSKEELKGYGISEEEANAIKKVIEEELEGSPEKCWLRLTREALKPDMPAKLHQELFRKIYNQDEQYSDAPIAWKPDDDTVQQANITKLMGELGLNSYEKLHEWSVTNRADFWKKMIKALDIPFKSSYEWVVSLEEGLEKPDWLKGAGLNIADACFREHKDETAIIYGTEDGGLGKWTYGELEETANRVANGLQALGFEKGDKAAIVMPMTAESVAIYLGIVKAGGAVVSIADSIAPAEVEKRLNIADTKFIFTQDIIPRGGKHLPLYEKFLELDGLPKAIVLPGLDKVEASLRKGDIAWRDFLSDEVNFTSVSCHPADNCNILFSSGTTGDPKAIPWTHTTPIKCAADGYLHQDIKPGDVVAWPTNLGWMMGPWLVFAALMNRGSVALYYGAPTGSDFGEFVQNARINMLGLIPSMVKRWLETDAMKGLDWSSIKCYSSTGESSNPKDYLWLMARAGYKPVIEYCGGTEIGGGYVTGTMVQPASPSAFTTPALGLDFVIKDEEGHNADSGELFVVPPSIGLSNTLINKDHHKTYYKDTPTVSPEDRGGLGTSIIEQTRKLNRHPILRRHGDELEKLPNGYFRALGRADDTMNIGGIKTSSVEIERLLDVIEGVKETAAIAVPPKEGGPHQLVIYAVLHQESDKDKETLRAEFQQAIKKQLNPLFKVADVVITDQLPRTASNKIMRRLLRDRYGLC